MGELLCKRRCLEKVTGSLNFITELRERVDFVTILERSLGPGVTNCKIVLYLFKEQEGDALILFVYFCQLFHWNTFKKGSFDK